MDSAVYTGKQILLPGERFPYRYSTKKVYSFCVPDFNTEKAGALTDSVIKTFKRLFEEVVTNDRIMGYLANIVEAWEVIAISCVTAIILGYLYLLMIDSCLGKIMIWLSILLIQVALIGGGYYIYKHADKYDEGSEFRDATKYFAYAVWGIAAFYLCCVCCYWNTIRIGIAVYQTTAQYVHSNMRIYLLPLVADFVETIWFTIWIVSAIYVFSVGEP